MKIHGLITLNFALLTWATKGYFYNFRVKDLLHIDKNAWNKMVGDLIEPLSGCQFILVTGIFKSAKFTTFILDVIQFLASRRYQQYEIQSSLADVWIHSRYYLRHSRVCMVYMGFQASPSASWRSRELNFPLVYTQYVPTTRKNTDIILLFIDAELQQSQLRFTPQSYQCEQPGTVLVYINRKGRLAAEAFVMLTRGNRQGHTALYSASSLGVKAYGSDFDRLFNEVRNIRRDFHGSPVIAYLLDDSFIQGNQVNRRLLKGCRTGVINDSGCILIELAVNLNFSVILNPVSTVTYAESCRTGFIYFGVMQRPMEPFYDYSNVLMSYSGFQLMYTDDVNFPGFLSLRSTAAPFPITLWLMVLSAVATIGALGMTFLKTGRGRLGFLFGCFTTLVCQFPVDFKRTAGLAILWTLVGFVITNHYLALLSSLTIVPQVVIESRSFLQLIDDGYKLTVAVPEIYYFFKKYKKNSAKYTERGFQSSEEDNMFILALERDAQSMNEQSTDKQIVVAFSWQVTFAAKIMARDFAQNAHILRRELLREALWYKITVTNSDVVLGKLAQLVASGIESNWLTKEMASRLEVDGRNLVSTTWGSKRATARQEKTTTLYAMLSKDDYLILESFCILTIGLGLSTALFVLNVGFRVVSHCMRRLCNYLSHHLSADRAQRRGTT